MKKPWRGQAQMRRTPGHKHETRNPKSEIRNKHEKGTEQCWKPKPPGFEYFPLFNISICFGFRVLGFGFPPFLAMPTFQYRALQADGTIAEGEFEARGRLDAFRQIECRRL